MLQVLQNIFQVWSLIRATSLSREHTRHIWWFYHALLLGVYTQSGRDASILCLKYHVPNKRDSNSTGNPEGISSDNRGQQLTLSAGLLWVACESELWWVLLLWEFSWGEPLVPATKPFIRRQDITVISRGLDLMWQLQLHSFGTVLSSSTNIYTVYLNRGLLM